MNKNFSYDLYTSKSISEQGILDIEATHDTNENLSVEEMAVALLQ